MGRFIWALAGAVMAVLGVRLALEGPGSTTINPVVWSAVCWTAAIGWAWGAIQAARGKFE